jgi:hypothetical protein
MTTTDPPFNSKAGNERIDLIYYTVLIQENAYSQAGRY